MAPPSQPSKPKLTPITVPPPSSGSPSHPSSPQLLTPHTPLTLQSSQPSDERSPLLRRVASIGPDTLRRKSHQISDLLFAHSEPLEQTSTTRTRSVSRARSGYFTRHDDDREEADEGEEGVRRRGGEGKGYDGDFRQELQGEGANGVRGWYGKSSPSFPKLASQVRRVLTPSVLCLLSPLAKRQFPYYRYVKPFALSPHTPPSY